MTNYLQKMIDAFNARKSGMTANATAWTGQTITTTDIDGHLTTLNGLNTEIENAKDLLQQKRANARQAVTDKQVNLDQVDNLARGIHSSNPEKLNEYNIKQRKQPEPKNVPAKAVIKSITDDDDGIGFKVAIQSQGEVVETWEVQRGEIVPATNTTFPTGTGPIPGPGTPASGAATVLQPPYPFLRTTKKLVFVDDDVDAGVRYFYRVRGVNSKGAGEWSEPVSAVQ